jgi:release factor glutamine methyltransferase
MANKTMPEMPYRPDPKFPSEHHLSGSSLWQWRHQALVQAQALIETLVEPLSPDHPTPNWSRELDWLLQVVTDLDALALRLETYRHRSEIPLSLSLEQLESLWQQRLVQRVPLQYLLGSADWRNFNLHVSSAVLIPRPETETIIDLALAAHPLPVNSPCDWADLGTGSGAIALGLALAFPAATIHTVDISPAALDVARQNVRRFSCEASPTTQLEQRVKFYHGSWFEPLTGLAEQLTGIVANPPYIPTAMLPGLQPEVARHEPHLALDGGPDGLACLRKIIQTAPAYLKPGGILLLEMMQGQDELVLELIQQTGAYQNSQIHTDLARVKRFAQAQRQLQ